eukprot:5091943-Pyramimonas_sp.AAC.1
MLDPRLDLGIMPKQGPTPDCTVALKPLGKAPANLIKPEAAPVFTRLDFPQACAALTGLIGAAGMPSRISGEAIYLCAAYAVPCTT